ncbi:hypothetical protein [Acidocella sp.]|uniref:hypothetical protein n=1 Tax=Acidocella sp. TaxID=50710 RepID=UPI0026031406|nr:hypothetical protein [Acidocella sp.]
MSDQKTDPFEIFQISREFLTAEQRLLPSVQLFEQLAETIRTITQANITYSQTLMRANASLLAALMARPAAEARPEPDTAAR